MAEKAEQEYDVPKAMRQPDTKVDLLGTTYDNPLVVASGTLVEEFGAIEPYLDAGAGAVIPRSTRLTMQRTIHPSPHLYQEGRGIKATMLNGEWTGAAIDYWRPHLEVMSTLRSPIIMSVSGRDIEGCVEVCKELDCYDFPLIEVNISCGVSNGVYGYITRNIEHVKQVCSAIKEAGITTPISLKLGHSDIIVDLAMAAKDEGADAITAINTYGPVLDFNIRSDGKPERVIGVVGAKGGLSGNALFHTSLTDVASISKEVDIPVLASGGVTTPERAVKMIMAGAYLVQLYTVLHDKAVHGPHIFKQFLKDFNNYLDVKSIYSLQDARGGALALIDEPTELMPQVPIVDKLGCIGCDACIKVCLPEAFNVVEADSNSRNHVVEVNDNCIGCGHCVSKCPVPGVLTFSDNC